MQKKFVQWIKDSIEANGTVKPYKDLKKKIFFLKMMMFGTSKKDVLISNLPFHF